MLTQKLAFSSQPPLIPTESLSEIRAGFGQQECVWGACEQVVRECQCEQAEVTPGRGTDMASTHTLFSEFRDGLIWFVSYHTAPTGPNITILLPQPPSHSNAGWGAFWSKNS